MPQLKKGALTAVGLRKRLREAARGQADGSDDDEEDGLDELNQHDLLLQAKEQNLLSALEIERSTPQQSLCVKRYLRTLVQNERLLSAIDRYVCMASKVRSVGSLLANLFALTALENNWFAEAGCSLDDTLFDQTFVKYCLLPFKASLTNEPDNIHPKLQLVWREHEATLRPMYPLEGDLRAMKWDQALTDMAREMIGAIKAHIKTHLPKRVAAQLRHDLQSSIKATPFTEQGRRRMRLPDGASFFASDAYSALEGGVEAKHGLPAPVAALVKETRQRCGIADGSSRKLSTLPLNAAVLRFHRDLSVLAKERGGKGWALLPVVRVHRTFAFVDERVLAALLSMAGIKDKAPEAGLSLLEHHFGVHARAWKEASRAVRKRHRANKRGRKQKKRCGYGTFPSGARCVSINTDGVALVAVLSRPLTSPPTIGSGGAKSKPKSADGRDAVPAGLAAMVQQHGADNIHEIAEDPGRANISQTTQPTDQGGFVEDRLTRNQFLARSCQDRFRVEERARRAERVELVEAFDRLSADGGTWKTTSLAAFAAMVQRLLGVHGVLAAAYVDDPWHAVWKMRLWRRKRMALMQHYGRVLGRAPRDKPVIFATGDGGFAATGRGERSVPTSGARAELRRLLRSRANRDVSVPLAPGRRRSRGGRGRTAPAVHVFVPEQRTTMCCHKCGQVMSDVHDEATPGRPLRGTKLCLNCAAPVCSHWCRLQRGAEPGEALPGEQRMQIKRDGGGEVAGLWLWVAQQRDQQHAHRLVNRDVNAARNIWKVVDAMVRGLPRPQHLVIVRRRQAASGQPRAPPRRRARLHEPQGQPSTSTAAGQAETEQH